MSEIIESSEVTEEQITDNEEVTEEITEKPTEETSEEIEEPQETEENPEEVTESEFDPEKALFEDESLYQIEGYDLTEFKEVVDLGDPEKRQQAESQLKQLKEMGFTQDQIKFLINNAVQDLQAETEPKKELKTQSEVNAYLNKNLDKDTKLNYIPLTRNVKEWFSGSKYEKHIGRMVKDPDFLNMVDYVKVKSDGERTTKVNTIVHRPMKAMYRYSYVWCFHPNLAFSIFIVIICFVYSGDVLPYYEPLSCG